MNFGLGRLGRSAKEQTFGGYGGATTNGVNGTSGHAAAPDRHESGEASRPIAVFHEVPEATDDAAADPSVSSDGVVEPRAQLDAQRRQASAPIGHVVHDLLKGLDVGFGIEAAQLEREAITAARAWAEKGLPRHDLEPSGPLDVEVTLARRTDLLASFADDADYIKESRRPRTRIVVFSDMLQSTPGMDFERDGAPDPSWIARQKEAGTLPMLPGACLVVVGAETRTAEGAAVKAFWKNYFVAAGARLPDENYRYTATEAEGLGCSDV